MSDDTEALRQRVEQLEQEVASLRSGASYRGVRKRSATEFFGWPLWEIAMGPDPDAGEFRGHARAIVACGDMATGFLAMGGLARGVIAMGGGAIGVIAFGGGAIGALLAVGGGAIGTIAIGGGAVGHYAFGGGALGDYVFSGVRRDPEAVALIKSVADFLHVPMP